MVLAVMVSIYSCAGFRPVLDQKSLLGGSRIPSIAQTREGITVSIEEFASVDKSKHAFDSDVMSSGVLPLLFRIESKSDTAYKIPVESIKAYLDKQPLAVLSGEAAAKQATTRDYVGKALGWTLLSGPLFFIAWPGTIIGSALHTNHINSRIIRHFETLQYKGALVRANQPAYGFVYFEIPTDQKILQSIAETKSLKSLTVEVVTASEGEGETVSFNIPFPDLDLKSPSNF